MAIDIQEDLTPNANAEKISLAIYTARQLLRLEMEIAKLELQLKALKDEHKKLSMESIPGIMEEIGVPTLALGNGYTLKIEEFFQASLPAKSTIENAKDDEEREALLDRLNDGMKWLRKNKATDLIRHTIRFDFGMGFEKQVQDLLAYAHKQRLEFNRSETVHPASLAKLLKEKLAIGVKVPLNTFGVFDGKRAKIIAPKKGKS